MEKVLVTLIVKLSFIKGALLNEEVELMPNNTIIKIIILVI